jgi:hypothetical protein
VDRLQAEAPRGWFGLDVRGSHTDADQLSTSRIAGKGHAGPTGQNQMDPGFTIGDQRTIARRDIERDGEMPQQSLDLRPR